MDYPSVDNVDSSMITSSPLMSTLSINQSHEKYFLPLLYGSASIPQNVFKDTSMEQVSTSTQDGDIVMGDSVVNSQYSSTFNDLNCLDLQRLKLTIQT